MSSALCNLWTGTFRSNTYGYVHGNIHIQLRPLDQWGYKTTAKINFTGFAAVIQSIFSQNMQVQVDVTHNKCFTVAFGPAVATLTLDSIPTVNDTYIHGHYKVVKGTYVSDGEFYLMSGANNFEKGGCAVM